MVKSRFESRENYALSFMTMHHVKCVYYNNEIDPKYWAGFSEWESVFDEATESGEKLHGYVTVDGEVAAYLILDSGWDIHFGMVGGYQALYILPRYRTRKVQMEVAKLMRFMEQALGCRYIADTRHVDGKLIQKLREVRRG